MPQPSPAAAPSPAPLVLDPTGRSRREEEAKLHAGGPATLVDLLGVQAWSISDPALLSRLLTDSRVSKDARQHWPRFIDGEIAGKWPLDLWVGVTNMFTAYGTEHRRLRRLVSPAFTARRTAKMLPRIEAMTTALFDDLATTEPGRVVDLREAYALPLPIQVIGELMGLSGLGIPEFRSRVDGIFDTTLSWEQATANNAALYEILAGLVADKRANPGDDMTSVLIAARDEEDGSALTEQELVDTLLLVISAGYETTVNLLDQAVLALLTHPEQLAEIRAGRATWADAVEETLRYEAPVGHLPLRYATEDIALGADGPVIRRGEAILASYGAAGRHPALHGESAERFDVTRPDQQHLSFGYGVHHCLGAPLARAEAAISLPALFDRFPGMRLAVPADELEPVASLIINGHRTLPVILNG